MTKRAAAAACSEDVGRCPHPGELQVGLGAPKRTRGLLVWPGAVKRRKAQVMLGAHTRGAVSLHPAPLPEQPMYTEAPPRRKQCWCILWLDKVGAGTSGAPEGSQQNLRTRTCKDREDIMSQIRKAVREGCMETCPHDGVPTGAGGGREHPPTTQEGAGDRLVCYPAGSTCLVLPSLR